MIEKCAVGTPRKVNKSLIFAEATFILTMYKCYGEKCRVCIVDKFDKTVKCISRSLHIYI